MRGTIRSRPPRYAVAIMQAGNQSFGSDAVLLQIDGEPSEMSVDQVHCYDQTGGRISDATASLQ